MNIKYIIDAFSLLTDWVFTTKLILKHRSIDFITEDNIILANLEKRGCYYCWISYNVD